MADDRRPHNCDPRRVREDDGCSAGPTIRIFLRGAPQCRARRVAAALGGRRAEDAYQETFLRALRAYGEIGHADNLRAWVLTIARRVAVDHHRRREATPAPPEPETDSRPAYAELGELADGLPRKERAAVVLRYGYDLSYAAIGAALGSSEDAARQAASPGVRRLRRRMQ